MGAEAVQFEQNVEEALASLPFLTRMERCARTSLIESLDEAPSVDRRLLLRRVLLHLPRFTDDELNDPAFVRLEVERRAEEVARRRLDLAKDLLVPRTLAGPMQGAVLDLVPEELAGQVHQGWHYLASPRAGVHLGLFARAGCRAADLLALATLSPLDVPYLTALLPGGHDPGAALVLSRLVAADDVPPNTMTHFMGRMFEWLRTSHHEIRILLSYLNPNLAFSGSVYRASNWQLFAREPKQQVFYVDGSYVTDREVIRRFGTNDPALLPLHDGSPLSISRQHLLPLEVFVYFPHASDRRRARLAHAARRFETIGDKART